VIVPGNVRENWWSRKPRTRERRCDEQLQPMQQKSGLVQKKAWMEGGKKTGGRGRESRGVHETEKNRPQREVQKNGQVNQKSLRPGNYRKKMGGGTHDRLQGKQRRKPPAIGKRLSVDQGGGSRCWPQNLKKAGGWIVS